MHGCANRRGGRMTKLSHARALLRLELADKRAIEVRDLIAEMGQHCSMRTFQQAKKELRLVSVRRAGRWLWCSSTYRDEHYPPEAPPEEKPPRYRPLRAKLCGCDGAVIEDEDGDPVCLACGKPKIHRIRVNGYEFLAEVAGMRAVR